MRSLTDRPPRRWPQRPVLSVARFRRTSSLWPSWPAPALTVIGLDAATFDVVDPLLAAGQLPHLAEPARAGRERRPALDDPPAHAARVVDDGHRRQRREARDLGLHRARRLPATALRLINGSYRRAPALWDRLRAAGRRAGIVNVPFTWPAPELDGGFAIAGMDASFREQGMTAPASLFAELRERLGALELDHSYPLTDGRIDLDTVRRAAEQKVAGDALAGRALRAGAPVRRVHGGRPRPASRLGGVGGAGHRERGRRHLPHPRRGGRRARRARGRRRRARRLRPRRGPRSTASST